MNVVLFASVVLFGLVFVFAGLLGVADPLKAGAAEGEIRVKVRAAHLGRHGDLPDQLREDLAALRVVRQQAALLRQRDASPP